MEGVWVWVLVISSWRSNLNEVEQFGNYYDKSSCQIVQNSKPFKPFVSECLRVKMKLNTN